MAEAAIPRQEEKDLSRKTLVLYGLPALAKGYMMRLMVLYAMKFATDVLLIAPFVIGLVFAVSRIWDAVTDPVVGYLSDRTRLRFGRRRSWMLGGTIPFAVTFVLIFAVPIDASDTTKLIWMSFAVVGWYTAYTCITVPHLSWGAELSFSSDGRNKTFGIRHGADSLGALFALGVLSILIEAESQGPASAAMVATQTSVIAAVITVIILVVSILLLREAPQRQVETRSKALDVAKDVFKNPHARLVLVVMLIELIGASAMAAMALYVAQYVIGAPWIAPIAIGLYLVVQTVSVPVWIRLAQRIPKHILWRYAMIGSAVTYGSLFFLAFIDNQAIQIGYNLVGVFFAGFAASCAGTIGPSVLSDIIDYDERQSGERREGSYFAAWSFAAKSAGAVTIAVVGFSLSLIGFVPNEEQTQGTQIGMTAILGLFPLICYGFGAWLFSRYSLEEG